MQSFFLVHSCFFIACQNFSDGIPELFQTLINPSIFFVCFKHEREVQTIYWEYVFVFMMQNLHIVMLLAHANWTTFILDRRPIVSHLLWCVWAVQMWLFFGSIWFRSDEFTITLWGFFHHIYFENLSLISTPICQNAWKKQHCSLALQNVSCTHQLALITTVSMYIPVSVTLAILLWQ